MNLINVVYNDKSTTSRGVVNSVGATVIKASRGGAEPVKFNARESKRIVDYFGIPDIGNEAIDDVLTYNNSYPIWVSAPSTGSRYGGVLVKSSGSIAFNGGKTTKALDFSSIENFESVTQVPDGVITNFTKTVTGFANYIAGSIDLFVNGVSAEVVVSGDEPEVLTCDLGSGTFTLATGIFDFTFTEPPVAGTALEVQFKTSETDSYFAVVNKNPQVDDLAIKITKDTASGTFLMNLLKKNGNTYTTISGFPKKFSMVPNTKDGFNVNIYGPVLFKDSDLIEIVVNPTAVFSTFTNDSTNVVFTGGYRGTTGTTDLAAGWEYFKQVNKYKTDIFFDTTADSSIPAIFSTLRNSYQKYAYYIVPTANASYSDTITNYSTIVDNKGVAYYWGWGKVLNNYTGTTIASSLMGRRALRLADMWDVFNGLAPAWYNEGGTHGGQLGDGIVEMFYDADDAAQELLYQARINPTVMHPTFGVVNTRERTSQSLLSDYSSIGHVRLADYLVKNIVDQALAYQPYKLNDFSHRASVKAKIENIISPTKAEPYSLLRDFIVKCDEENNNDEVLAREEFVVSVAIKFTPFSRYITLFFTNSAQGSNVSEDV